MRCESEKILKEDLDQGEYQTRKCDCGNWLRPDIIWFQDMLNEKTVLVATQAIASCDLFISIGTSAVVWPAAGYPKLAKDSEEFDENLVRALADQQEIEGYVKRLEERYDSEEEYRQSPEPAALVQELEDFLRQQRDTDSTAENEESSD